MENLTILNNLNLNLQSPILCKAANDSYQGHNIASSWFITKSDCIEISKDLAGDVEDSNTHFDVQALQNTDLNPPIDDIDSVSVITQSVQCSSSPFSEAFNKHYTCRIVIDTEPTPSLVSKDFIQRTGIK